MQKYVATCTCGDKMEASGNNKDEAFKNLMEKWTPEDMKAHWDKKHAGQPMPSMGDMKAGLKASMQPAM